jgi:hypothetical protein
MAKKFPKNPYMKIYRGEKTNTKFHRPEGAGNFDNMDDVNIVKSISILQGTIDQTASNPKDILNKATADTLYSGTTYTAGRGLTLTGTEFTTNDGDINHNNLLNYVANQHIDWSAASAGTIHASNYVDNNTTYVNSDWNHDLLTGFVASEHIDWSAASAGTIDPSNYVDNNTTYVNSDWNHDLLTGFVANEHIDWTTDQGATNIDAGNYTDTNTTYVNSDWDHDQLTNFVANEHIDWTTDQGATNINAGNYTDTNTTYVNSDWNILSLSGYNASTANFLRGDGSWVTPPDTNTTYVNSDWDHNQLTNYVANRHIDWTAASAGTIHATNYTDTNTQLTQDQVDDFVDNLIIAGSNITKVYDDTAGTLTLSASGGGVDQNLFNTVAVSGQSNIVADTTTDTLTVAAGSNVTITTNATTDTLTIAATDNNTTYTAGTGITLTGTEFTSNDGQIVHDNLSGFVANEHIDWTAASAGTIHATNYTDTNTTYTAGSGVDLVGTEFSHTDTSSQSSVDNSGRTYIQDITLDTYGHVTALTSATETVTDTNTHKVTATFSRGTSFPVVDTSKAYPKIGEVQTTSTKGLCAIRDGSIVGISVNYDVGSTSGKISGLNINADVNGTTVWQNTIDHATGLSKEANFTQSAGTDSFSAGDTITVNFEAAGSSPTVNIANVIIHLEMQWD